MFIFYFQLISVSFSKELRVSQMIEHNAFKCIQLNLWVYNGKWTSNFCSNNIILNNLKFILQLSRTINQTFKPYKCSPVNNSVGRNIA